MPGRVFEQLLERAQEQHGLLRTDDVRAMGLDPKRLVDLEQRGHAERISQGVYRLNVAPHTDLEEYMAATMWPRGRGVIGHETALDLYDVSDINPNHIDITIPPTYRITRPVPTGYRFHRRRLGDEDVARLAGIPIVTVRRAILDCIEIHVRRGLIEQAIDTAQRQARISRADAEVLRSRMRQHLISS